MKIPTLFSRTAHKQRASTRAPRGSSFSFWEKVRMRGSRQKLRAATARRSIGLPDSMDYEQMSEPNMKLSRALLIVLVLHVVAVAGIIAFNTIKPRQTTAPAPSATASPTAAALPSVPSNQKQTPRPPASQREAATKPAHPAEKIVAKIGPKTE